MATSAVLTTTACSDSDLNEVVPETPQEVANAYFQMTVDVSSTSSDTRATLEDGTKITKEDLEDTPKTDDGIEFEQKLTKAYIYLFKVNTAQGATDNGEAYSGNPIILSLSATSATDYSSTVEKVPVGTYHAYVTFNEQIPLVTPKSAPTLRTRAYSVLSTKKEADFVKEAFSPISGILTTSNEGLQTNGIPMSSNAAQITQETSATGVSTELTSSLKDTIFATIKIDDTNTKTNPLKFTVKAVRCLAKISYMNTADEFPLWSTTTNGTNAKNDNTKTTGKLGTVKLLSYAPFNVERHYYMFRHVGDLADGLKTTTYGYYYNQKTVTTSGSESATTYSFQYVYDPNSSQKGYSNNALTCADTVYLNALGGLKVTATGSTATTSECAITDASYLSLTAASTSSTTGSVLAYVPENVMTAANQKRGYVTGVIFKAQLKPTEVLTATFATTEGGETTTTINGTAPATSLADDADLYFYQPTGKFYTDLATLLYDTKLDKTYKVEDLDGVKTVTTEGGGTTKEAADDEVKLRNSYGIYYYAKGICYYPFYIYHKLSSASTMQPMEYAIVRNNDYQLTVNTVAIRTAEGINLTPTEDVELKETYLQATVTIAPWTVRSNSMDLGNY
jgi:hypothetical protein